MKETVYGEVVGCSSSSRDFPLSQVVVTRLPPQILSEDLEGIHRGRSSPDCGERVKRNRLVFL